jgi:hypothetical protein
MLVLGTQTSQRRMRDCIPEIVDEGASKPIRELRVSYRVCCAEKTDEIFQENLWSSWIPLTSEFRNWRRVPTSLKPMLCSWDRNPDSFALSSFVGTWWYWGVGPRDLLASCLTDSKEDSMALERLQHCSRGSVLELYRLVA